MKYIWLFGENLGKTADNNAFYFWSYVVGHHDDLSAYYIMERTPKTLAAYKAFTPEMKKHTVWRNSPSHIALYARADMLFVAQSFRDVQPDRILMKSYKPEPTQPLVYLQHGTLAMKQLGYREFYANNCMFRWIVYNPGIAPALERVNGFKPYQILDGEFPPRYMEMARRAAQAKAHDELRVLWFMTWREYFGENDETKEMLLDLRDALTDPRLREYAQRRGMRLTLCLHHLFTEEQVRIVRDAVGNLPWIRLATPQEICLMDELAQSDLMITDYSSIGFDFTFLGKPVLLYQHDRAAYMKRRAFYCTMEELEAASITDRETLVSRIIEEAYGVHPFFAERMHHAASMDDVIRGGHIERMYQYFLERQKRCIAFLGYDFSGVGGTVFATRALAEGLMEQGRLVRMITLKQVKAWRFPAGVSLHPMYTRYRAKLTDKLKVALVRGKWHFRHLQCDPALASLQPAAGLGMTWWMKHIHADTVISTRESLHLFLREASSPMIRHKLYFFHTAAAAVEQLFPGCMKKLAGAPLDSAVFVTEANRLALADMHGLTSYRRHIVLGNALDSTRSVAREEISPPVLSDSVRLAVLMRLSADRRADILRMMAFVQFMKEQGIEDVHLDVYGGGDFAAELRDMIARQEAGRLISLCGETADVRRVYLSHDAAVDFSAVQSFGMTYIEAVLCGRMVFCRHNEGSGEVLGAMPECFYETDEQLLERVRALGGMTDEDYLRRYDAIAQRYSRESLAGRLTEFIEQA